MRHWGPASAISAAFRMPSGVSIIAQIGNWGGAPARLSASRTARISAALDTFGSTRASGRTVATAPMSSSNQDVPRPLTRIAISRPA